MGAGDPAFRRAAIALFTAGVATFALLYAPQPLLPLLAKDLDVSPATSTLALAVTTAALALSLLPAGWLSDAVGRTTVMRGSVCASAVLGLACAAAPSLGVLLVLRALLGVALAGMPAVAMAYLADEVAPGALGRAMGLVIGGNAIGGMGGRLLAGVGADLGGWRVALLGVGLLSATCAAITVRTLPASRSFTPRRLGAGMLGRLCAQLTEPGLVRLYAMGALLMGTFVAVFNGLGFRLTAAPYGLGQAALACVSLVYPIGSVSSARAGTLADRLGRRAVLPGGVLVALAGLALTAAHALPLIVLGIAVLTAGFFAAHSVSSSWIGRRAPAHAAQASALYLLAYYGGSSLAGPLAGTAWTAGGWNGVLLLTGGMLGLALLVSLSLRRTPPLVQRAAPGPLAAGA
jgi:YNFM family putative membrane transporter